VLQRKQVKKDEAQVMTDEEAVAWTDVMKPIVKSL
jgi:hypothetical protein